MGTGQASEGSNDDPSNSPEAENSLQAANSSCVPAAAVDTIIMPVVHEEPAVSIEPEEADAIESAQFAGRTERMLACGFAPQSSDVDADSKDRIFICTLN